MTKTQASDILNLAFALGLHTPRVFTGYEAKSSLHILTHGLMPKRHEVLISPYLSLEEAGRKLAQSGNIPLSDVLNAISNMRVEA